jgi:hypothetical protein
MIEKVDKAFEAELTKLAKIMGWDKWPKEDQLKLACALFWYSQNRAGPTTSRLED